MKHNKKDLQPFKDKTKRHGEWITYNYNGTLQYKGNFINDKYSGMWLWYDNFGNMEFKEYYI